MMSGFVVIQAVLLCFMLFHDWIPVPPLNDIEALKKEGSNFYRMLGSLINGTLVFIPLLLTLIYGRATGIPLIPNIAIGGFYLLLTVGTILSWWVPYFFGSSTKHKKAFQKFKNTHHFLPPRGDHVVPNTLHVLLHLQVWAALAISIYYL